MKPVNQRFWRQLCVKWCPHCTTDDFTTMGVMDYVYGAWHVCRRCGRWVDPW